MGKRVHEVLEWLYLMKDLKNKYIVFDKIIKKYNQLWNDKFHSDVFIASCKYDKINYNESTVYSIGVRCLRNYYNRFSENGYFKQSVYGTELKFQTNIGDCTFLGYIDRIDKNHDGSIDVIDYKTSKKSKSYYQAKNDFQLAIYYLAVKEIFSNAKINLNLYYLRTNEIITIEDDIEKILAIEKKIKLDIVSIKNEKYFYAKESLLCEWCYFWKECEIKSSLNPSIRVVR